MSKRLSTYIASFDYFDRSLIVLSATSGDISIASFAAAIGIPVGIANASISLAFSLCAGLLKKLLKTTGNKENHVMLARSKLSNIESKISETLMNNQISHEDFLTIINEERNCTELKESIRIRIIKGQEDEKIDVD